MKVTHKVTFAFYFLDIRYLVTEMYKVPYACQALPDYGSRLVTRSSNDVSKISSLRHLLTPRAGPGYKGVVRNLVCCGVLTRVFL